MKVNFKIVLLIVCLLSLSKIQALNDPPPPPPNANKSAKVNAPPPPPSTPIDKNVGLMLGVGLLFGIHIIYSQNKKEKTPM